MTPRLFCYAFRYRLRLHRIEPARSHYLFQLLISIPLSPFTRSPLHAYSEFGGRFPPANWESSGLPHCNNSYSWGEATYYCLTTCSCLANWQPLLKQLLFRSDGDRCPGFRLKLVTNLIIRVGHVRLVYRYLGAYLGFLLAVEPMSWYGAYVGSRKKRSEHDWVII